MTEIIPWIEDTWRAWAQGRNMNVTVIDVDAISLGIAFKACLSADLAVVTCFNLKVSKFLTKLRNDLSIDVPFAFYLHNQATIACWPLQQWKLADIMTEADTFIGTCQRDLATMKLCFRNAKSVLIPFSLTKFPRDRKPRHFQSEIRKFTFIGRISAQKNLHTLLWAFSLMKEKSPSMKWEFHIFGLDDELGSPLMGLPQIGHEKYLKELVKELHLSDEVVFRGFVTREKIEKEMESDKWIFVTPSLHGDENFGMAALRCLLNGHLAVLSDWGGHTDFIHNFRSQVKHVRVYESEHGPWIDASELADVLYMQSRNNEAFDTDVSWYSPENIYDLMDKVRDREGEEKPIVPTPVARDILLKRQHYVEIQDKLLRENKLMLKDGQRWSQIYENYADKTAHAFQKAYGMENVKLVPASGELKIAPWVFLKDQMRIKDPHRGEWIFEQKNETILTANGWATKFKRFV